MIIGITGKSGAGKGTVAEYLKQRGFVYHSLSDVLRSELKARRQAENLPNLIALGNKLRTAGGPGVLGQKIAEAIKNNNEENSLVDSIRNPAEIMELKQAFNGFKLIAVDAPLAMRHQRISRRGRPGDEISLEEFTKLDAKELKSNDSNAQQILECIRLADYTVVNEGSLEELQQKVKDMLVDIGENS